MKVNVNKVMNSGWMDEDTKKGIRKSGNHINAKNTRRAIHHKFKSKWNKELDRQYSEEMFNN